MTHAAIEVRPPYDASASWRGRARFAGFVVGFGLFLIFMGGQVTTTLAGDSVPSWPASFFFPADRHQMWELGHRWVGGTMGILTLLLGVWIWRSDGRPTLRRAAIWAAILVVAQALLGGLRVHAPINLRSPVAVVHTMMGQSFFALVVAMAAAVRSPWLDGPEAVASPFAADLRRRATFALGAVWCQILLGAILRHITRSDTAFGTIAHVLGAVAVVLAIARLVAGVILHGGDRAPLRRPAGWIAGLLGFQLLLGLAAFLVTHTATGYVNPQDVLSLLPTVHLVIGSSILGLVVVLRLRLQRFLTPE